MEKKFGIFEMGIVFLLAVSLTLSVMSYAAVNTNEESTACPMMGEGMMSGADHGSMHEMMEEMMGSHFGEDHHDDLHNMMNTG